MKVVIAGSLLALIVGLGGCDNSESSEGQAPKEAPTAMMQGDDTSLADMQVEFETAMEGYNQLRARKDLVTSQYQGWRVFDAPKGNVRWIYAAPKHPAYPLLIRQVKVGGGDAARVDNQVLCDSGAAVCRAAQGELAGLNRAYLDHDKPSSPKTSDESQAHPDAAAGDKKNKSK